MGGLQELYLANTKICYRLHPRKFREADMTSGKCIVTDIWVCPMPKCYHERLTGTSGMEFESPQRTE